MGCCCEKKTLESHPARCQPGDYPKNPAYAGMTQQLPTAAVNPMGTPGFMTGGGMSGGAGDAMAVGYMMGHGNMMGGIDGGPRVAIGGNYHGMM